MRHLLIAISFFLLTGFTGQRRVVVLDTGLNLQDERFSDVLCKEGHKDFTRKGIEDRNGHGTHVAGIIKNNAKSKNYCLIIVKYYENGRSNLFSYIEALKYAASLRPDIVNLSGGGYKKIRAEFLVIKNNPNVKFIVAAGNDNRSVFEYFPAAYFLDYDNVIAVGALDGDNKASFSNYGEGLVWKQGVNVNSTLPNGSGELSGTSMSAALKTAEVLSENR